MLHVNLLNNKQDRITVIIYYLQILYTYVLLFILQHVHREMSLIPGMKHEWSVLHVLDVSACQRQREWVEFEAILNLYVNKYICLLLMSQYMIFIQNVNFRST